MTDAPAPSLRIDKWLWHARLFKSRTLAARLCAAGRVRVNGTLVKKAHAAVRAGDVLTFPKGRDIRVIRVLALGQRRGPAVEAQGLYEDLQPPTPRTAAETPQGLPAARSGRRTSHQGRSPRPRPAEERGMMRKPAFAAALALAVLLPATAGAAYVIYFRTYGEWSVICARDEPSERRSCTLSAPPPALAASRSVIAVGEPAPGAFSVTLHVLGLIASEDPVYLRIDSQAPHQARADRIGTVTWSGAEAAAIIQELRAGGRAVVRSFGGDGQPRDEILTLEGFAEALESYRAKLRLYGITTDR